MYYDDSLNSEHSSVINEHTPTANNHFVQGVKDVFGLGNSSARAQNQINRDFQERMANTQWQRGITDMKKAGINPLAAFTSASGAGSGGAGGQSAAAVTGIISNVIGSTARLLGDLESAKATNMRTDLYRNNLKNLIVSSAKFLGEFMGCLKPIQVYNLKKGEKAKFKKYFNSQYAKWDMNKHYKSNNAIPCRKCIGCKLNNSKEWAMRSALECKSSQDNWFITLTYADEFVPVNDEGKYTCRYSDLRRFTQNLRQFFTRQDIRNIKYLASSEYGSRTQRPHYHICFFGLPLKKIMTWSWPERSQN